MGRGRSWRENWHLLTKLDSEGKLRPSGSLSDFRLQIWGNGVESVEYAMKQVLRGFRRAKLLENTPNRKLLLCFTRDRCSSLTQDRPKCRSTAFRCRTGKSGYISRGSRDLHKYLGDPHRTHPPDPRNGFPSDDIADPWAVYSLPKFTILPDIKGEDDSRADREQDGSVQ